MKLSRRKLLRPLLVTCLVLGIGYIGYLIFPALQQQLVSYSTAVAETAATNESTDKLQSIVSDMYGQYGSDIGLVVMDLSNGATATTGADTEFVSASIYKLFVAYGVYASIDAGTIALTDSLKSYGTTETVEQCLDVMLTVSDNTCGKALGLLYGWDNLDTLLASEGFDGTTLNNYDTSGAIDSDKLTTATDTALLLRRLYDGSLLNSETSAHFLALLKADEIDYMLPSGLPDGATIAHKVGYSDEYQHDAGIIYGETTDVLVVMFTKGWQESPASEASVAFKKLSAAVWQYAQSD